MLLDTLTKLTEHFSNEQLIVNTDRCLNARFKQADCHTCVDACPVDAIHLDGQQVWLDSETCARCGACVWQCPTEVFAQSRPVGSKLPLPQEIHQQTHAKPRGAQAADRCRLQLLVH